MIIMVTGRCEFCEEISKCPHCSAKVESFKHVGVRAVGISTSTIWHIALPCGHRVEVKTGKAVPSAQGKLAKYNGGPLWGNGYKWFNVYWGSFWQGNSWVDALSKAVTDIETNPKYSGELSQYNVGVGTFSGSKVIATDPPSTLTDKDIGKALVKWVADSTLPDLQEKGAYNVFLPPGVTATLGTDKSCTQFCDYHDTANGNKGPFFTCEPYPCSSGCNQCNNNNFQTLVQGLSEEMVELKTDMDPGTGWVIGNEEVCDYCDKNFVCHQLSTGEFVNAWYSDATGSCWTP